MTRFAIFQDIKLINRFPRLDDADVISVFGDLKVDYTRTALEPGDHQMHLTTFFGDVKLRFPESVGFQITGFSLFGDVEVENLRTGDEEQTGTNYVTENFATAPVRIQVHIITVFGDFEIVRVPIEPGAPGAAYQAAHLEQHADEQPWSATDGAYEGATSRLPRQQ